MSKLDLSIVVALVAGCAFWIERGQRVVIDAPTQSELAAAAVKAAAAGCPDNDNTPYSIDCILFMSGTNWRVNSAETAAASSPAPPADASLPAASSPCPKSDAVPYSDACLAYLQGATILGWRVRAPPAPAPLHAPTPIAAARGNSGNK